VPLRFVIGTVPEDLEAAARQTGAPLEGLPRQGSRGLEHRWSTRGPAAIEAEEDTVSAFRRRPARLEIGAGPAARMKRRLNGGHQNVPREGRASRRRRADTAGPRSLPR